MQSAKEILDELRQPVRALREQIPSVFDGYAAMSAAVMGDGALDAKTKELIALAVAVAKQCDGCIASHARVPPAEAPPHTRLPRRWASRS